jgi:serine/threonine protein kinase
VVNPSSGLVPQSIFAGQFRIVGQLARGGMGTIYQVEQLPTGHPRALKVILPEYAQDPKARARFEQEARIAARIESEHAAQVIAAGVDAETNTPWLAMELLQGRDLSVVLGERGRLPPAEVGEVMKQLGHALSAAHRIGVVHRDLKPENIFIATSRRSDVAFTVKVLDFGVAKWAQESRPGQSTAVVGSPLWMSPEQLDARGILGPHTDIWALGLLAYAMLTGRPYWRGAGTDNFSLPEVVGEIMAAPLVPASHRATEQGLGGFVPPGFDAWFARCVERDGAMRFRTVEECVGTLLQTLGVPAMPQMATPAASASASSIPATMAIPAMPTPQQGSLGTPQPAPQPQSTMAWSPEAMGFPGGPSPFQGASQPSAGGSFGPAPAASPYGGAPSSGSTAYAPPPAFGSSPGPYGAPQGPYGAPQGAYGSAQGGGYGSVQGGGGYGSAQGSFGAPQPPMYGAAPGYGGTSAPWQQQQQPRPSGGSGVGLMVGIAVGAFLLLCGGGTAAYFAFSPSCDSGQHRSDGHCCPNGSRWNRTQRACVSTQAVNNFPQPTYPQPTYPQPTYPQPGLTPLPSPTPTPTPTPTYPPTPTPRPTPPRPTFVHACDGVWSGNVIENTGARGSMDMMVRTSSPVCARWTENWQSGARCIYVVQRCTMTPNGIRGTGRSFSARCTPTVSMGLTCTSTGAAFREQVGNVIDTAMLGRR